MRIPINSLPSSGYSAEWVRSLGPADRAELARLLTPKLTKYIPPNPKTGGPRPTVPQSAFLLLPHLESLYGGAAGGGKSDALLMAALQYVDVPGYAAIIFRRRFTDLTLPDALIPRSHDWLRGTDAKWNDNDYRWTFPGGATLSFGYLAAEVDKYRYQGAAFNFCGFDELTHFSETQYRYLLSRMRRPKGSAVPIRVRSTANPGGVGHEWVKRRFFTEGQEHGRPFVPAKLADNPHLDRDEYRKSLAQLDPVTRRRLEEGDWEVRESGGYFKREWFKIVEAAPPRLRWVRRWDMAATEVSEQNTDPDWTAGVLMGERGGQFWVKDVRRCRRNPGDTEAFIKATAEEDGRDVEISMEQEPGSAGKSVVASLARGAFKGFSFTGKPSTGDKVERAKPFSAAAFNGNVFLVRGAWNGDYLDELEGFPAGGHDDMADSSSGAHEELSGSESVVVAPTPKRERSSAVTM